MLLVIPFALYLYCLSLSFALYHDEISPRTAIPLLAIVCYCYCYSLFLVCYCCLASVYQPPDYGPPIPVGYCLLLLLFLIIVVWHWCMSPRTAVPPFPLALYRNANGVWSYLSQGANDVVLLLLPLFLLLMLSSVCYHCCSIRNKLASSKLR